MLDIETPCKCPSDPLQCPCPPSIHKTPHDHLSKYCEETMPLSSLGWTRKAQHAEWTDSRGTSIARSMIWVSLSLRAGEFPFRLYCRLR
ncbi:uncharacterized protein J3R85_002485 [Psidium guajava]|nr:uncharacterized protein J3R85_002485 [Psidium guajava]